jgi:hypothetical protein
MRAGLVTNPSNVGPPMRPQRVPTPCSLQRLGRRAFLLVEEALNIEA